MFIRIRILAFVLIANMHLPLSGEEIWGTYNTLPPGEYESQPGENPIELTGYVSNDLTINMRGALIGHTLNNSNADFVVKNYL